ncbi:hypothetical protein [Halobacteriovorax sp. ZH4_bin.1]|uniref:hypothetical protein n=1 Tax=unclassified Halobacteriovorax TaxID=2639665 RepID=UPI00371D577B
MHIHQRVKELRKELLMQPVKLTLGLVLLPIIATLGGFADGGPINEFRIKPIEAIQIGTGAGKKSDIYRY